MNDNLKTYLKHIGLFLLTFLTATLAGTWWINGKVWPFTAYEMSDFVLGMKYSVPFLLILTVHEFGHYFMAKYHKIKTTLPFYIPIPPFPGSIGTMGAIIKIKEHILSKKIHFDIGIAGPLAGFVIALAVLIYGYSTLPELDYLFEIHPSYAQYGDDYAQHVYTPEFQKMEAERLYNEARTQDSLQAVNDGEIDSWSFPAFQPDQQLGNLSIGKPLLMQFMESFVSNKKLIPNASEIMHYPMLMAGFLALLVTALNLMPIGQLDGGHVLYGLIGTYWHRKVATVIFIIFVFYAGLGIVSPDDQGPKLFDSIWIARIAYLLYLNFIFKALKFDATKTLLISMIVFSIQYITPLFFGSIEGYSGWLVFAFVISRFVGIYHPPAPIEEPLDLNRQILGWLSLLIFIISFSPAPIVIN